ncbi:diacylglycerol O-acyltransferase 1-like [Haliaeetus albicilla]|uniref:diacylglycerol O-acyltransferase 1-like n=1 Tax=Haliaeetus albicilla TaxID=8969 RepID=UPI0037E8C405
MCPKMPWPIAGDTEMRHRDAEGLRHGLLFDPIKFILVFMKHPCKWPAIYLIAASLLLALPAVFIERYFKKQNIPAIAPGRMKGQSEQITYPVTLKVKGLCYFLLASTLRYHLNFLRNSHCRHSYIIKRLLEVECRLTLAVVVQVGYPSPQMARQTRLQAITASWL